MADNHPKQPESWEERRERVLRGRDPRPRQLPLPFPAPKGSPPRFARLRLFGHRIEWALEWTAYWLQSWAFVDLLKIAGGFSLVLVGLQFCAEADTRERRWLYETWAVVDRGENQAVHGARNAALEDLARRGLSLAGLRLPTGAWMERIDLRGADLRLAQLDSAQLQYSKLSCRRNWLKTLCANLLGAELPRANFYRADLSGANLMGANLSGARLSNANLSGARLSGADLSGVHLGMADLSMVDLDMAQNWERILNVEGAVIAGVRNAPSGFVEWALSRGAALEVPRDTTPGEATP
jgi:hypothetical protein